MIESIGNHTVEAAEPSAGRQSQSAFSGKPLTGRKIAVIVEHEFIPEEIAAYDSCFKLLGADVHFVSRLWGNESITFVSDVETAYTTPQLLEVTYDLDPANPKRVKVTDYDAVLMAANYTSCKLRYDNALPDGSYSINLVRNAPAVRFFAEAMAIKRIVKGALCHGLWILTPHPALLKDRTVTCHVVVLADVLNAGANVIWPKEKVVVDDDLVTGFSKHEVVPYIAAIAEQILLRNRKR
jgi:protease I